MQIITDRPARIAAIMAEEGVDEMQAHNIHRARNVMHDRMRRDPRAFDFRFGKEL